MCHKFGLLVRGHFLYGGCWIGEREARRCCVLTLVSVCWLCGTVAWGVGIKLYGSVAVFTNVVKSFLTGLQAAHPLTSHHIPVLGSWVGVNAGDFLSV